MNDAPPPSQFLIYQTEDGRTKIDVGFEGETVWLTQPLMAELFQTTQQNISAHLQNIYEEGELDFGATHKKLLSVRREGNRDVQRQLEFYNLDAIISVGYRVKSRVATQFRQPRPALPSSRRCRTNFTGRSPARRQRRSSMAAPIALNPTWVSPPGAAQRSRRQELSRRA